MIKQAKFMKSGAAKKDWIEDNVPEICFVGRSNVGKSTFINAICNQNKLAKTSSTPGKTRLLNFFDINNSAYRIVDAPGYGYARVSFSQKEAFGIMMEEYLLNRSNLKGVCQLVDLRHKPTNDDISLYQFFKTNNIRVLIIATKKDKCKKNDIIKNEKLVKSTLDLDKNDIFLSISSVDKANLDKAIDLIEQIVLN
ncbi:ribosome biogenesis GTP-binding protein YihA/YsxC [Spiroplasma tabanidicola]|uniref:Probable GTP-binding protein EngB n=1 Tax=Spiroplasma tabanidicola TaxID=324079 RepID=A0A6I6CDE6_9MOLU|nr:ribosome biogenesis GTP-binding protein YihA/YsxC [Spiroplasma tabanidicola]QGS52004.1 GTP-binding protein [Spiroplasma tabanidicola]